MRAIDSETGKVLTEGHTLAGFTEAMRRVPSLSEGEAMGVRRQMEKAIRVAMRAGRRASSNNP